LKRKDFVMGLHVRPFASLAAFFASGFSARLCAAILCLMLSGCAAGPNPLSPIPSSGAPSQARVCPPDESAPADLLKQPNYRQITFAAQTSNGLPPAKLTAGSLRLYQGNKQLPIAYFRPEPVTVGILVDNSGSMQPKLAQARDALTAFIQDLNPKDQILVATFADQPHLLAPLTTDHQLALDHLAMMHAYGRTALYDVILQGLHAVAQACGNRKALLVMTDGMDTASSSSLSQVMAEAREAKVPIYSIGIGDSTAAFQAANGPYTGPQYGFPSSGDLESVDAKTLDTLAKDTGGRSFLVAINDKSESLKMATTAIAANIGNRYIVGFVGDGSSSQVRVQAPNDKDLVLKGIAAD